MGHKNGASANGLVSGTRFGSALKKLRESRTVYGNPMSQSHLARGADFDNSHVSRLENGERNPTREAIERLATALNASRIEEITLFLAAGILPESIASLLEDGSGLAETLALLQEGTLLPEDRSQYLHNLRNLNGIYGHCMNHTAIVTQLTAAA